jgi:hypothetical protein
MAHPYSAASLVPLVFAFAVHAAPVSSSPVKADQSLTDWSKEAISSLLGFFAAILTLLTMVLISSRSARGFFIRKAVILEMPRTPLTSPKDASHGHGINETRFE